MNVLLIILVTIIPLLSIGITIYWSIIASQEFRKPLEAYFENSLKNSKPFHKKFYKTFPDIDWPQLLTMVAMLIIGDIFTIVIFYNDLAAAVICMLIFNVLALGINSLMIKFYIGGAYFAVSQFEYNDKKKIKIESNENTDEG